MKEGRRGFGTFGKEAQQVDYPPLSITFLMQAQPNPTQLVTHKCINVCIYNGVEEKQVSKSKA